MGTVYLAEDLNLELQVAIKLNATPMEADLGADQRKRFLREAQAMARINHPNLARIYRFDEVDEQQFIVMEFVEGEDLQNVLDQRGKLAEGEATVTPLVRSAVTSSVRTRCEVAGFISTTMTD